MTVPARSTPTSPSRDGARSTESALALPSLGRALSLLGRAVRLRCPHCGRGAVLRGWHPRTWGAVRERCSSCGFRYTRSDDRYFAGAMLCNLLLAELLFAVAFVTAVLLTWPAVPWDGLTYAMAAAMAAGPVLFYPLSVVLWLTVDVLVRPVTRAECG